MDAYLISSLNVLGFMPTGIASNFWLWLIPRYISANSSSVHKGAGEGEGEWDDGEGKGSTFLIVDLYLI